MFESKRSSRGEKKALSWQRLPWLPRLHDSRALQSDAKIVAIRSEEANYLFWRAAKFLQSRADVDFNHYIRNAFKGRSRPFEYTAFVTFDINEQDVGSAVSIGQFVYGDGRNGHPAPFT